MNEMEMKLRFHEAPPYSSEAGEGERDARIAELRSKLITPDGSGKGFKEKCLNELLSLVAKPERPALDLQAAAQLLDDCLIRIYPEEFLQEHIDAAAERFSKGCGTIARISDMADKLRKAAIQAALDGAKGEAG